MQKIINIYFFSFIGILNMVWINQMNEYGSKKIPFIFIIDFLKQNPLIIPFTHLHHHNIYFNTPLYKHLPKHKDVFLTHAPLHIVSDNTHKFEQQFKKVLQEILIGNSYLINLTMPFEIKSEYTLEELFYVTTSEYKILYNNEWLCFSPECFLKTNGNKIYTYPIKGSCIDSNDKSGQQLLDNKKEHYEHATIVDLLRNDLGIIATNVNVKTFKDIRRVKTHKGNLLQMYSQIEASISNDFYAYLGDYFNAILPAGSITGAPKKKTVEIILQTEQYKRGFYTGIFGVFDGKNIDSCVLIRFIEKDNHKMMYKTGAGITSLSIMHQEYQELLDKIYAPIY